MGRCQLPNWSLSQVVRCHTVCRIFDIITGPPHWFNSIYPSRPGTTWAIDTMREKMAGLHYLAACTWPITGRIWGLEIRRKRWWWQSPLDQALLDLACCGVQWRYPHVRVQVHYCQKPRCLQDMAKSGVATWWTQRSTKWTPHGVGRH